jgi:hypothetical protein
MANNNNWNANIANANNGITFQGGTVNIGSDATDNAINIGTSASSNREVAIGSGASTSTQTVNINCGTGGVTLGTNTVTCQCILGVNQTSSATTIQSGTGGINLTGTNGAITVDNSTTLTLTIGGDTSTNSCNLATGAGNKILTIGSTNTSSSLTVDYGTGNFSLASATGNLMTANSSGYINYPLLPAAEAYLPSNVTNATGNSLTWQIGTSTALTLAYNQGSHCTTGGTFTSPVTGLYLVCVGAGLTNCTINTNLLITVNAFVYNLQTGNVRSASSKDIYGSTGFLIINDAGDTIVCVLEGIGESGNTNTVVGTSSGAQNTFFSVVQVA